MVNRNGRWHYLQVHVTIASGRRRSYSVPAQWADVVCGTQDQGWQAFTTPKVIRRGNEKVKSKLHDTMEQGTD